MLKDLFELFILSFKTKIMSIKFEKLMRTNRPELLCRYLDEKNFEDVVSRWYGLLVEFDAKEEVLKEVLFVLDTATEVMNAYRFEQQRACYI